MGPKSSARYPKDVRINPGAGQIASRATRNGYRGVLLVRYYIDLNQSAPEQLPVRSVGDSACHAHIDQRPAFLGGEATMWNRLCLAEKHGHTTMAATAHPLSALVSPTVKMSTPIYSGSRSHRTKLGLYGLRHRYHR